MWKYHQGRGNTLCWENKYKASPTYQAHYNFLFHSVTCISQIFVPKLSNGFRQTTTAQLKIITSSRSIVQASRTTWMFPSPRGNTISKGKIPYVERTNIKPHQLIRHTKISYSMVSLVFHKFSYQTCQNDLNQGNQSWGAPSTSKNTSPVSSIVFVRNPDFSILLHRVRYLKNLFMSRR